MGALNFRHLRYFWLVAKAGSIARASERLHLTPQTIRGFENVLGYKLFGHVGRRVELTDAGRVALSYADEIFTLGEELEGVLRSPADGCVFRRNVTAVSDGWWPPNPTMLTGDANGR